MAKSASTIYLIEEKPTFAEIKPSLSPILHTTNLLQHIKTNYTVVGICYTIHAVSVPSSKLKGELHSREVHSSNDLEAQIPGFAIRSESTTEQIQLLQIIAVSCRWNKRRAFS